MARLALLYYHRRSSVFTDNRRPRNSRLAQLERQIILTIGIFQEKWQMNIFST